MTRHFLARKYSPWVLGNGGTAETMNQKKLAFENHLLDVDRWSQGSDEILIHRGLPVDLGNHAASCHLENLSQSFGQHEY
jgi:hypothetical protein